MLKKTKLPIVKKPLLAWVLKGNPKLKLVLLLTVVVTVIIRVAPLELQKRIVNQAINLKEFDLLLIYCSVYLVAVMKSGKVAELRSYDELMAQKGLLHELVTGRK